MDKNKNIIDFLKNNKINGVAFGYMTKEVQEWVNNKVKNHQADIFKCYDTLGVWNSISNKDFKVFPNDIIYLLEDYKEDTPKATEGEWVEFEIDQRGNFHCFMDGDMHYFFWANWNAFLDEAHSFGYTAFGGWQYENCDTWFMFPMMREKGVSYHHTARKKDYIGAVPIKIRFWMDWLEKQKTGTNK